MNDKDNKLIALFMGLEEDGVDGYLVDMDKDYGYQVIHESCFLYDSSWDWLMPVVQKIYQLGLDNESALLVRDAVTEANLDNTYQAVVEFIKTYNNEEKENTKRVR
tara:strand:- start:262 stop:579 length:318 start_codon:yes stop_codon:yes gene_type:complete